MVESFVKITFINSIILTIMDTIPLQRYQYHTVCIRVLDNLTLFQSFDVRLETIFTTLTTTPSCSLQTWVENNHLASFKILLASTIDKIKLRIITLLLLPKWSLSPWYTRYRIYSKSLIHTVSKYARMRFDIRIFPSERNVGTCTIVAVFISGIWLIFG